MVEDFNNFKDLLLKMLAYLPERRITAGEALKHPFFNSVRAKLKKIWLLIANIFLICVLLIISTKKQHIQSNFHYKTAKFIKNMLKRKRISSKGSCLTIS